MKGTYTNKYNQFYTTKEKRNITIYWIFIMKQTIKRMDENVKTKQQKE